MAGKYDLGEASGRVTITTDERGFKKAADSTDNLGTSARRTAEGFEHLEESASDWEKTSKKATTQAEREAKALEKSTAATIEADKAAKERKKTTDELTKLLKDENATEEDITKAVLEKNKATGKALQLAKERRKAEKELLDVISGFDKEVTTTVTVDTRQAKREIKDLQKAWDKFYKDQAKAASVSSKPTINRRRSDTGSIAGSLAGGLAGGIAKTGGIALGGTALGGLTGLLGAGGTGALASGVTGLASALAEMSGVLGTLPAALGATAVVVGTLQVATSGFADALKNLGQPDFEKGLKDLSQNARDAAWTLNALYPEIMQIKKAVQDEFMKNFAQDIIKGFDVLGPVVTKTMKSIAGTANSALQSIFDDLTSGQGLEDFNTFLSNTTEGFRILATAAQPFFEAFRGIMAVGSTFLPQIASDIKSVADDFSNFINTARNDGSLQQWIQSGIDATKTLWSAIKNLGQGLSNIIKIGSEGGGFLSWLDDMAKAFNE